MLHRSTLVVLRGVFGCKVLCVGCVGVSGGVLNPHLYCAVCMRAVAVVSALRVSCVGWYWGWFVLCVLVVVGLLSLSRLAVGFGIAVVARVVCLVCVGL